MTTIAMIRRRNRPCVDDWNAWAAPWKLGVMFGGSVALAALSTRGTASLRDTPGLRLKEIVTEGSCPRWFTRSGPVPTDGLVSTLSGTSFPEDARTYSMVSEDGSVWYWGNSSMMTWYWFVGARIVDIWSVL